MKDTYQNSPDYNELEDPSDYNDGNDYNNSKINFLDICSIIILLISIVFLIESIIF
ncbi:hypothetical protein [Polaribacter glomeratus]|uniref:hypothetical protein n=1 Tax=Polaribacter glomeratus TaxID=102 RepID=UPI0014792E12|nr:hypothetical protein [Polaribacter glomeratus]